MKLNIAEYKDFIKTITQQIKTSQIKAHLKVNEEMLKLYWYIGGMIVYKQKHSAWGDGLIEDISKDLQSEFPNIKGFSSTNIKYMRKWYLFYSDTTLIANSPQLVDHLKDNEDLEEIKYIFQIPWGQNREIINKCKDLNEALFYVLKTIENNYSRSVLVHQIESNLFKRSGKAITNFDTKLPKIQSDLANEITKDPYNFDFLNIQEKYNEKELENALTNDITKFLLELGQGFSFVGKQYKLNVDGDEFFCDLLFYHLKLYCYIVVELKVVPFKPEFTGKLNFYISAVDSQLKTNKDNPTIGILICKSKKNTIVEYSLKDINKPIGVSEYCLTSKLPDELKSSLPSIEDIEANLDIEGI
jgi:predicted nuclease of restriction endonuclease-like (RecB) superfamily